MGQMDMQVIIADDHLQAIPYATRLAQDVVAEAKKYRKGARFESLTAEFRSALIAAPQSVCEVLTGKRGNEAVYFASTGMSAPAGNLLVKLSEQLKAEPLQVDACAETAFAFLTLFLSEQGMGSTTELESDFGAFNPSRRAEVDVDLSEVVRSARRCQPSSFPSSRFTN